MLIKEIDLHTAEQKEIAEFTLRKIRRMMMSGQIKFPTWFELIVAGIDGPKLSFPANNQEIHTTGPIKFTAVSDITMSLNGWSSKTMYLNEFTTLYVLPTPKHELDKEYLEHIEQVYDGNFSHFISSIIKASDPIFSNIGDSTVEIRQVNKSIVDKIYIMGRATQLKALLNNDISKYGELIAKLYVGKQLPAFVKMLKDYNAG